MLIKARKHLEQWDSCLWNKDVYLYFSKITTKDKDFAHEGTLGNWRFRVWYCSCTCISPTCLSSNLCFFTILTPTLTHSQAFVLMSPLPNHLSLSPPSPFSPAHTFSLHRAAGVEWLCLFPPPPSYPFLSLRLSFPFSLCLSMCVSLSLSGSWWEEGGGYNSCTRGRVEKKKRSTQRKQLQSPPGCQLQSPQPLAFFNQANRGKTVAVERHQGPHSISPTWWSQPQQVEFTLPEGLSTERSSSLHEKYPL